MHTPALVCRLPHLYWCSTCATACTRKHFSAQGPYPPVPVYAGVSTHRHQHAHQHWRMRARAAPHGAGVWWGSGRWSGRRTQVAGKRGQHKCREAQHGTSGGTVARERYAAPNVVREVKRAHWAVGGAVEQRAAVHTVGQQTACMRPGPDGCGEDERPLGLSAGLMTEPDLVQTAHINSRNFVLNSLEIGDGCAMRTGSRLLSGVSMEDMFVEHTLLTSGDIADARTVYSSWPAKLYQE
ncbi:hypothetical protein GGX14DRAFT_658731 [Mycena pura]|uniref:Uncharacterized protein n=1 Tax=Mycena pura TaxID=153505 RepID=A0AAD6V2A2_9AGAR|nr:hypothetical protein GGX14DRAFT_658731 [Mycena pura]